MGRSVVFALSALVVMSACGGSASRPGAGPTASSSVASPSTSTPRSSTSASTTTPPTTAPATTTTARSTTTVAASPSSTSPATAAPAQAARGQRIVVSASGYGTSYATFTAYDETERGWVPRFGPWTARIGRNGFAPTGAKREGDGRTPSGTYTFSFFFGINANPGLQFSYRQITSRSIVWDDDPTSANYNEWIDSRVADAGRSPEPMYNSPFYDYGAVIAYNTARTAGLGSAIFLHVSNGGSTAGCVALPVSELLDVLRWLEPGQHPEIRMGVGVGP